MRKLFSARLATETPGIFASIAFDALIGVHNRDLRYLALDALISVLEDSGVSIPAEVPDVDSDPEPWTLAIAHAIRSAREAESVAAADDEESAAIAETQAMICSECGERVHRVPPRDWLDAWGAKPSWSHAADDSQLCAIVGDGGYEPAQPEAVGP